jgi:putative N6-adenine-specific DNA methylase
MAEKINVTIKCLSGCEEILAAEMKQIGADEVTIGNRVVFTEADMEWVYRANLCLRTALRIYIPFKSFRAKNPEVLYHKTKRYRWEDLFSLDQTFAVDATVHSQFFTHSKFASLKVKDAIVDQFRMRLGQRPNVDPANPDYRFHLHIQEDRCTISLDTSGRSLHRRGYRVRQGEAPMSEVLAASILRISGWKPEEPLINPMCGSGTFVTEAALMAENRPPQIDVDFGFKHWSDYNPKLWGKALEYAQDYTKESPFHIIGFDKDRRVLHTARANADAAGYGDKINLEVKDFFKYEPGISDGHVFINPPYDVRLQDADIEVFYERMGNSLKKNYSENTVWMITGNRDASKKIGLRTSMKKQMWNGPIECRLLKFEMYRGSKK